MKLMPRTRPSPAMVVAVVALSLGLAGSAVAANGVLGKAQVKTVANKQITKRAPSLAVASATIADTAKSADTATTATTAATATTAETAKRATNVFGAQVDSTGVLLGSIPGGVTVTHPLNGLYKVDFPRPVEGCLIFSAGGSNDGAISGAASVSPRPAENPNRLAVVTLDTAGTTADRDFYVQITCP